MGAFFHCDLLYSSAVERQTQYNHIPVVFAIELSSALFWGIPAWSQGSDV